MLFMRKSLFSVFVLLLLSNGASVVAQPYDDEEYYQSNPNGGHRFSEQQIHDDDSWDPTQGNLARLNLSGMQMQQLQSMHDAFMNQNQDLIRTIEDQRAQLRQLHQNDNGTESDQEADLRNRIKQERSELRHQKDAMIQSILSPQQAQEYAAIRHRHHAQGGNSGHHQTESGQGDSSDQGQYNDNHQSRNSDQQVYRNNDSYDDNDDSGNYQNGPSGNNPPQGQGDNSSGISSFLKKLFSGF